MYSQGKTNISGTGGFLKVEVDGSPYWAAYTTHTQAQCKLVSKLLMFEMSLTCLCMCIIDGIAWENVCINWNPE